MTLRTSTIALATLVASTSAVLAQDEFVIGTDALRQAPQPGQMSLAIDPAGKGVTLRFTPDPESVPPPTTPATAEAARRSTKTYSDATSATLLGTTYMCRSCQTWTTVTICEQPGQNCREVWVKDGSAESQCGSAPAWMVAR